MNLLAWGGGAALVAVVAGCWRYILVGWSMISSRVVVNMTVHEDAAYAMLAYLRAQAKESYFGPRAYVGWHTYVRPRKRCERVVAEDIAHGTRLFWFGWRPIWVSRSSETSKETDNTNLLARPLSLTFLRGLFDADTLAMAATRHFNANVQDENVSRYYVYYYHGTVGKVQESGPQYGDSGRAVGTNDEKIVRLTRRMLEWRHDDIGPARVAKQAAMDQLSLDAHATKVVDNLRNWKADKQWFQDRGLPWRYNILAYGKPGTGKTAFVRAIAEELDLPVFVFDLTTMYNHELRTHWQSAKMSYPAVVLLEDLDGVFHGREPATEHIQLTFDALLNCIDGVERTDGLVLFVTTNAIEKMDPALGVAPRKAGDVASRPGRIDTVLHFETLDLAGRRKLAFRVLQDWPELADLTASKHTDVTGAQFERICIDLAWSKWKEEKAATPVYLGRHKVPLEDTEYIQSPAG